MQVRFFIADERKRVSSWTAVRAKRTRVPGSFMAYGDDVPHDLVQYVVEAATGYENGFWGLVARGATFKSTGRRRTKPGRALIAAHRRELAGSEQLAQQHVAEWRSGLDTGVAQRLRAAEEQWRSLEPGDEIVFEWPSPAGHVERSRQEASRR
jgi:hypothetical protein